MTSTGRFSVAYIPREEFLERRFHWKPGEHVVVLAPTGWGKTHLLYQLTDTAATERNPAYLLVLKPRDETVEKFRAKLGWPRTDRYPPPLYQRIQYGRFFRRGPKFRGLVVWPKHEFDPSKDDPHIGRIMRRAILHSYKKGNRIVVVDEAYSMGKEYGLDREMVTVLSKGRSMETAMFGGSQKPTHIPLWFYSQSDHLFIGNDPDKRARQRYGEIGGVDPKLVEAEVSKLHKHEFLYIRRNGKNGPEIAVIGP